MSDYCHKIGHGPAMMDSDCLKEDCLVCEIERLQAGKDMLGAMVSQDAETIAMLEARVEALEGVLFGVNGALTRMDRARKILAEDSDSWQMLNTDDIRAATEQEGET